MNVCCVVFVIVIVLKNEFKMPGGRLNVSYFNCIPDSEVTPEPKTATDEIKTDDV